MTRKVLLLIAVGLSVNALATDVNEIIRPIDTTIKSIKALKPQATKLQKVNKDYSMPLAKLQSEKPSGYTLKRDELNEKYTHALTELLTPLQKSSYRKMIRSIRQEFIRSHPEIDADNIFIWGGANIL